MRRNLALAIAAAALLAPVSAQAQVVTFDEYTHTGYFDEEHPLTSGGLTLTNSYNTSDALGIWGANTSFNADADGATVLVNYGYTTTTVVSTDSSLFDLLSIDLADVYNNGNGGDVLFSFITGSGTTNQTITVDNLVGLQTFAFNMTGLSSFTFTPINTEGGWLQLDNITIGSAVPEPSTWAMMLMGFGAVGLAMRRRRRSDRALQLA